MHIYEGVLAATPGGQQVLIAGALAAAAGTAVGLAKINHERLPQVAVLSSAFFVASMIHVPLGPTSEHLLLSGLMGLVLGWAAFPAILIALLLQAVFFMHGGITTLGVNTVIMALPAVVCHYLFRWVVRSSNETLVFVGAFAAGAAAVLLAGTVNAAALMAAGQGFRQLAPFVVAFHVCLVPVEGLVTGSVVVFLRKVRPEILDAELLVPTSQEVSHG